MNIKSGNQITDVDADGNVSYTVPQETQVIPIESLRMAAEQAQVAFDVATDNLERATGARDSAQAIYDAALALQPKESEAVASDSL